MSLLKSLVYNLRKTWRMVICGDRFEDQLGLIMAYKDITGDETLGYFLIPIRPADSCDHERSICTNDRCFARWHFLFPHMDFQVTRGGQWYVKVMQYYLGLPDKYKEQNR